ncbi:hypothetical protein [Pseudomonas helleri]|uniref:hypothetical protein n=1 Tax=Pseudomonas helleri TaxID=1608996 RepID=UPI0028EF3A26|nr:hypothetical protein [Pseudomonas helleri]
MSFCLFLSASADHSDVHVNVTQLEERLDAVNGVVRRSIHVPAAMTGGDPFLLAERAPPCVIQLYFSSLEDLESALSNPGTLARVFDLSGLDHCRWTQQAMLVRRFIVPHVTPLVASRVERITYLVAYEGNAEDNDVWLTQYLHQHPPLMVQLPGIREVEVYTRIDYCSDLKVTRVSTLQRNKAVFDSVAALGDALQSPLREDLRKDFLSLPLFCGASPHYSMQTFERLLFGQGTDH